jgi:hypothetical protein
MLKRIALAFATGVLVLGISSASAYAHCKPDKEECATCW